MSLLFSKFGSRLLPMILVFVAACNAINPEEEIPAYIEINTMNVSSNYVTQGTNSSKITDVWVYADNEYIGTYELPARFPILLSGKRKITFGAGIEANGIASTSEFYPLYKFYDAELDLVPGQITKVDTVTVNYFPALIYTWYEDFESDTSGGGISLDTTGSSEANILTEAVEVFEGQRSLKMQVNTTTDYLECVSVGDGFTLLKGKNSYLEMNYKCDQPFNMGLIAITSSGQYTFPVISINPKTDWNKIYIRLGPYVNANGSALKFKVIFGMQLAAGATEGTAYIDNLKLISN